MNDLIVSWKCKIAALECFTELLRTVNELVKEVRSRDFVAYIQQLYRFTRAQRVVISLMLTAVPAPPSQRGWRYTTSQCVIRKRHGGCRIPVTMDIAEFNNGPPDDAHFRDLLFAYHRSLLHLASTLVVLEYNMYTGIGSYNSLVCCPLRGLCQQSSAIPEPRHQLRAAVRESNDVQLAAEPTQPSRPSLSRRGAEVVHHCHPECAEEMS